MNPRTRRPSPPDDLTVPSRFAERFEPAPQIADWVRGSVLAKAGALPVVGQASIASACGVCLKVA